MPDDPITFDVDLLKRIASVGEPHHNALLEAIRAEFGDRNAITFHTVALAMLLGNVLRTIPNADRAPDGIASIWSVMGVPFVLEAKRVQ